MNSNIKLDLDSEVFKRAIEDIVTVAELRAKLDSGRPLRIKHGVDATSPDLHLGHAANLWKIRALQEAGHKAVILFGDATTLIGDPTGRMKARPVLSEKEIERNIDSLRKSVRTILLTKSRVYEERRNSEWYKKMRTRDFINLLSLVTHARLIERDMFQSRIREQIEIYMSEMIYPVLQGYDSVELKSDLTIIGSDQIFNEHLGRFFQEKFGQEPQVLVGLKIIPGLDGGEKMSKSLGNFIGLNDSPRDKFGKTMRLPDSLIVDYLWVYTDEPEKRIEEIAEDLRAGQNPREAKLFLAKCLVRRYHGEKAAEEEYQNFIKVFSRKEEPEDVPIRKIRLGVWDILDFLVELGLAQSRSEARRLLEQGAVEINGLVLEKDSKEVDASAGSLVKVGKHRFIKIA